MSYQEEIKRFKDKANFRVVTHDDPDYPYARSISNSRFHFQPAIIAYCENAADVGDCLRFSEGTHMPFRIRSGGHHHEGMSSGNGLMIIDLSAIGRDAATNKTHFEYVKGESSDKPEFVWVPSATKLSVVYTELGKKGMIIPGGGCQSVNVGGLTQGGGWGVHVRKYGLACDQLVDAEVVLPNGTVTLASKANEKLKDKLEHEGDLLWALRGGGGGNFGVVTRFKFRLCPLNAHMTTFGIFWKKKEDILKVISRWAELHEQDELPKELSCTTNMWRVNNDGEKPTFSEPVRGRMGGNFYGKKADLLKLLVEKFGELIPMDEHERPIEEDDEGVDSYFSSLSQKPKEEEHGKSGILSVESTLAGSASIELAGQDAESEFEEYLYEQFNLLTGMAGGDGTFSHIPHEGSKVRRAHKKGFAYDVLPDAPETTCDMPHPHKITSLYPKEGVDHRQLAEQVYEQLAAHPFLGDVNRYMVWHCLGGAMRNPGFGKASSFAFRHKPYMLQLQSWWNHAGQLRNDKSRDQSYTQWVNDFRKELDSKDMTEGAFINFVDRDIPVDGKGEARRLELLKHYYGKNLNKLREIKTKVDPDNVFDFEMGLPPR